MNVENQRQLAQEISLTVRTCDAFVQTGKQFGASGMGRIRTLNPGGASGPLVELLARQEIGVPSQPKKTEDGYIVFVVCTRVKIEAGLPSPEAIEERLRQEKINLKAQRYLRDLRRSAYVDLRQ